MEFNLDKCEALTIPANPSPILHKYQLHSSTLARPPVGYVKYLGVTIQADLKWDHHIQKITSKASRTLGMLRRNIRVREQAPRELAYKALVRPQVEYASSVWDPPKSANTHQERQSGLSSKIEKVQRRGARFVCRQYRYTSNVDTMLEDLKWTPLEHRRRSDRLCFMYKVQNALVSIPHHHLPPPTTTRTRGHGQRLRTYRSRLNCHKFSFFPLTVPK